MENKEGRLIMCPNCMAEGKRQFLGNVKDNGDLLVLRFHHGTTIVKADKYSIVCGCGYVYSVAGTVVVNQYGKSVN